MTIGTEHFRRKKCVVFNLNPTKTKDGDDHSIRFLANGRSYDIKPGEEVDLLEPAYNTLTTNIRIDHNLNTTVDDKTGDVTHTDTQKEIKQFSVIDQGGWYWPEGHSPYDKEGVCIRHDLTTEELAKAPNPKSQKDAIKAESTAKKTVKKTKKKEAAA